MLDIEVGDRIKFSTTVTVGKSRTHNREVKGLNQFSSPMVKLHGCMVAVEPDRVIEVIKDTTGTKGKRAYLLHKRKTHMEWPGHPGVSICKPTHEDLPVTTKVGEVTCKVCLTKIKKVIKGGR